MLVTVSSLIVGLMMLPRLQRHRSRAPAGDGASTIDARGLARMFAAPGWLRDLGLLAWFVVGLGLVLFGLIWLLAEISSIVEPLVAGTVVAAVAGPAVGWLAARGLPRAGGITGLTSSPSSSRSCSFIGAFVSGAFAVILALASEGTGVALAMLVVTIAAGSLFGMVGLVLAAPIASAAVHISRDLALARAAEASQVASAVPLPAGSKG